MAIWLKVEKSNLRMFELIKTTLTDEGNINVNAQKNKKSFDISYDCIHGLNS